MAERVKPPSLLARSGIAAWAGKRTAGTWFVMLVVGALVTAVLVAVLVDQTPTKLSAAITQLDGGTASAYTVTYKVTKNPLSTAECQLQAEDENHDTVGTIEDRIGPTSNNVRSTERTVSIPTTDRAVTAVLGACSLLHVS